MRNLESDSSVLEIEQPEGIEAEKGMADFLSRDFSCISDISRERSEFDDRNGIDMVADIEHEGQIYKLAIEVSGPDKKRREEKAKRQWHTPIICLHDQNNKPVGDPIPRVLIGYNVGYLLSRQKEAEKLGVSIDAVMTDKERSELKGNILNEILRQIDILSVDKSYRDAMKQIKEAFLEEQKELEEMGL